MEPLGVQERNIPRFKGLISANLNSRAQGRDIIFNLRHALLKKAILLHKHPYVGVTFIFLLSVDLHLN